MTRPLTSQPKILEATQRPPEGQGEAIDVLRLSAPFWGDIV